MSYLNERVSFLKGLVEGMKINETTNEGKLLTAIIEVLDDVAIAIENIEEVQEQFEEQMDCMDEDLEEIENTLFGDIDDTYIGDIECPNCKETFELFEDMLDDGDTLQCPKCNHEINYECCCDTDNSTETE